MSKTIKSHLEKLKSYHNNLNRIKTLAYEDRFWLQHKITKSIKFVEKEIGIVSNKLTLTELRDMHMNNLD